MRAVMFSLQSLQRRKPVRMTLKIYATLMIYAATVGRARSRAALVALP
jgi:hypothetical protein